MDELLIREWGPPRYAALGVLVLALGLLGLAVAVDPVGRLLLAAGGVLLALGASWMLAGPALAAGAEGVRVRGMLRTHVLAWDEVDRILVDDRRRSRAVELETGTTLLAVPALLLGGVSPQSVAGALRAFQQDSRRAAG